MFTALLDTSVLWPSLQRDLLLSLAVEGLFRPVWSSAILAELEFHEARKLVGRGADSVDAAQRAHRLVQQMNFAFGDAETVGWESLEGSFGLPDPDDEHVAAAAVVAGAAVIVTANLRDFPAAKLPAGLKAVPPADFAEDTIAVDPARAARAVDSIVTRSGRRGESWTRSQVLTLLDERYGWKQATDLIRGLS